MNKEENVKKTKKFNHKIFIEQKSRQNIPLEKIKSEDISKWLECSVRYIQKWAMSNNVKYFRIHGIKQYIWDGESLQEFETWYNKKQDKRNEEKKKYYVPVEKPPKPESIKKEKVIPFITIKDIVDQIIMYDKFSDHREVPLGIETKIRYIQKWCKKNNIPYKYIYGRKYYKITEKTKSKILKTFKTPFKYVKDIL
jgi:hypothetical protein